MAVKDATFENTKVFLDGEEYISCTFINCVMEFSGQGLPQFQKCSLQGCSFTFTGAAQITLTFLQGMATNEKTRIIWDEVRRSIDGAIEKALSVDSSKESQEAIPVVQKTETPTEPSV